DGAYRCEAYKYHTPGTNCTEVIMQDFSTTITEILGQLSDLCEACSQQIQSPYLLRINSRGLVGKYRCPCRAEWNCWWDVSMAQQIGNLSGRCCENVLPYEIELDFGRARADWECDRCGRLWSYSDQA